MYLAKGGFGIVYKAMWKDGYISWEGWNSENNQWKRYKYDDGYLPVALKCLHNNTLQNITVKFLREV